MVVEEPLDEYQVLAKMMRIALAQVTWPGKPADEPLRLAVIGGLNFGTKLDQALERGTIGGRSAVVTYLSVNAYLDEKQPFDVLFIDHGWAGEEHIGAMLRKTQGRPVLTMGYSEGLARRGVMMNFYLDGSRMRFEINPNRIKQSRLTLSSYLMNMSKIVES